MNAYSEIRDRASATNRCGTSLPHNVPSLRRTMDPALMNRVINDPSVRPWVGGGDTELDITPWTSNPANVILVNEHGGFCGIKMEPGVYELHTNILPEGRGAKAVYAAREACHYLFTKTDAQEIVTKVPAFNKAAERFARTFGYTERFRRANAMMGPDGLSDITFFAYTIDQWVAADDLLPFYGEWFHHELEQAKIAAGSALPVHDDDPSHDRAVGAAIAMIRAGHATKGVWYYNRWARFAGYATIELLSINPVIVDVRDAIVEISHDNMEVLQCR